MTGSEPSDIPADEGVKQIPVTIQVPEAPGAADARESLLKAIGKEAELVADKYPGQASKALTELAHAYALVTVGTSTVAGLANTRAMTFKVNMGESGDPSQAVFFPERSY
ncbi:hypothetical protein ACFWA9_13315 [Kitasatospora sp. NPDC059973]|uniref:hypothetical protein n=1 Tax=Kitasatospora sp. NPDC059973 TaxID=3347020 RepID=UPI0036A97230